MLGIEFTGRAPFQTIYLHGIIRDSNGEKMSKTKGNVVDPIHTVDEYGCDALRSALVQGTSAGQDVPLDMERIKLQRYQ
jgi:valyl-tRNA synthetase